MVTSGALSQTGELRQARQKAADKSKTIRGIATSVLINGALPFVVYSMTKNVLHTSDFVSVVASGVPPLVDALIGIARRRRRVHATNARGAPRPLEFAGPNRARLSPARSQCARSSERRCSTVERRTGGAFELWYTRAL